MAHLSSRSATPAVALHVLFINQLGPTRLVRYTDGGPTDRRRRSRRAAGRRQRQARRRQRRS